MVSALPEGEEICRKLAARAALFLCFSLAIDLKKNAVAILQHDPAVLKFFVQLGLLKTVCAGTQIDVIYSGQFVPRIRRTCSNVRNRNELGSAPLAMGSSAPTCQPLTPSEEFDGTGVAQWWGRQHRQGV